MNQATTKPTLAELLARQAEVQQEIERVAETMPLWRAITYTGALKNDPRTKAAELQKARNLVAGGMIIKQACETAGISVATFYSHVVASKRWGRPDLKKSEALAAHSLIQSGMTIASACAQCEITPKTYFKYRVRGVFLPPEVATVSRPIQYTDQKRKIQKRKLVELQKARELMACGMTVKAACKASGVSAATYQNYRRRAELPEFVTPADPTQYPENFEKTPARKKRKAVQLQKAKDLVAGGMTIIAACEVAGISDAMFYIDRRRSAQIESATVSAPKHPINENESTP